MTSSSTRESGIVKDQDGHALTETGVLRLRRETALPTSSRGTVCDELVDTCLYGCLLHTSTVEGVTLPRARGAESAVDED